MPRQGRGPYLAIEDRGIKGQWYVIRDGRGKHRTGCPAGGDRPDQKLEAEKKLATYIAEKYEVAGERCAAKVQIADVLLHYSQVRVPYLAVPKEDAIRIGWLGQFFGPHTLSFITGANCRAYVKWRSPRAKPQTARRELDTLGAAINLYNKEFRLDSVPVVTKPPPAPPREGWLTRQQVARLIWAAHRRGQQHLVRFILISVYSGTRTQAVLNLRWLPSTHGGWIDLEHGLLYRRGAGVRETKKRTPPARLHARLAFHAERWRRLDNVRRRGEGGNLLPPVTHVIHYGGEPVERIRCSWDTACRDAKIPESIVKHNLRHTAATWLMQAGIDKWEACGYLGMTLETLDGVYGHHHPDFQRAAAGLAPKTGTRR